MRVTAAGYHNPFIHRRREFEECLGIMLTLCSFNLAYCGENHQITLYYVYCNPFLWYTWFAVHWFYAGASE